MTYRLGIDLGTTFTAAAYVEGQEPRMLELGNRNVSVPSVLFLPDDGQMLFGEAAERRAAVEPERVIKEFKRRFGDGVPMVVANQTYDSVGLQAELLRWVLRSAVERLAAPPDHVVVTHPANWGPYKLQLMRDMLDSAGIGGGILCPEPVAAAVEYAAKQRVPVGAKLAVYDLGGGTFDVAVLEKTETDFTNLGTPVGIEHLGGTDFDEAVFAETMARLGVHDVELDLDDPAVARELNTLRRECVEAKEALSTDVETEISSSLLGSERTVRWSRGELEALIRPALAETLSATARALQLAGVAAADLECVVLVGGSSRIPLVTELLQRELGVQVALDTYPNNDIAMGAARYAVPANRRRPRAVLGRIDGRGPACNCAGRPGRCSTPTRPTRSIGSPQPIGSTHPAHPARSPDERSDGPARPGASMAGVSSARDRCSGAPGGAPDATSADHRPAHRPRGDRPRDRRRSGDHAASRRTDRGVRSSFHPPRPRSDPRHRRAASPADRRRPPPHPIRRSSGCRLVRPSPGLSSSLR